MSNQETCCSSCAASEHTDETSVAVACALDFGDVEQRVASIQNLPSRHLLSSRREPLALHLTYAAAALPEVEALVAREAECCAFLDFELQANETVELTIRAPESAASAIDELFAYFVPEKARAMI